MPSHLVRTQKRELPNRGRTYLRDGRAPIPIFEVTSRVMSANRGRSTGPEMALRHALWVLGIRGYRLHVKEVPGRPDITFTRERIAVFVHGCFWHRCPHCRLPLPRTHTEWWRAKFEANQRRDKEKTRLLHGTGWRVLTLWECRIRRSPEDSAKRVQELLFKVRRDRGAPAGVYP